jgi:hypothetical protein
MTQKSCPNEDAVVAAARSGNWSPELAAHRNSCLSCAELTLVVAVLARDAEGLDDMEIPLPEPGPIWLRAHLASRERDFQRATRAIVWVQRATIAVFIALGFVFVPRLWDSFKTAFSRVALSLPTVDLPRTAGSPLLVFVICMLVLGALALWELTAAQEN